MAKFLRHESCGNCGSSDALAIYSDDSTYCFSCRKSTQKKEKEKDLEEQFETRSTSKSDYVDVQQNHNQKKITPISNIRPDLSDRSLSLETTAKYQVFKPEDSYYKSAFPLFVNGEHKGNKFRLAGDKKGFNVEGDIKHAQLFGQTLFPAGSARSITITEGYEDAMAAFEMTGSKYPCVSVHSASTAPKDVAHNFEYLNSFDEIVIAFDKDEARKAPDGTLKYPGQEAALAVASMFPLGKVRILTLAKAKDANDYLKAGLQKIFVDEWWKAPKFSPLGLRYAKDMWEIVKKKPDYNSVPFPWEGLNKKTYGIRQSELITITAHPKVGKTSVLRSIVKSILDTVTEKPEDTRGIGLMFLEEPNRDTLLGLMSLQAHKPLHLPDVAAEVPEEELKKYFDSIYNNEKIIVWNHFGANTIKSVLDYVRYMNNLGCKYIIIDHLSIIVSDQSGDERKQLDEISTKLKQLSIELNIAIICVIHQNRKGEIRGTAGVEQLSNLVIKLFRNLTADDSEERNTMKVSVEMNRFSGDTGTSCYLRYDPATTQMDELTEEEIEKFKTISKTPGVSLVDEW